MSSPVNSNPATFGAHGSASPLTPTSPPSSIPLQPGKPSWTPNLRLPSISNSALELFFSTRPAFPSSSAPIPTFLPPPLLLQSPFPSSIPFICSSTLTTSTSLWRIRLRMGFKFNNVTLWCRPRYDFGAFVDCTMNVMYLTQSKAAFGAGSRYGESEIDNIPLRFKNDELSETWYNQFIERYRMGKPSRLSSGERESEKRTPEEMSAYLKLLERHKKRRVAFKEDPYMGFGNPIQDASHLNPNSLLDGSNSIDSETSFFPETMFTFNCVPDSALPPLNRVDDNLKMECFGVLDTLPQIMTRSPVMLERLGIRPEYLSMERGIIHRGKNAFGGNKKCLSQEQATQLSKMVVARMMISIGFEGTTEVPIDVFSKLLSCHIQKLGGSLKLLADSYRKQCSALEQLKMFLQTVGYGNFGSLVEQVKDGSRNFQQTQQQIHGIQSQLQPQHQNLIRLPQQVNQQMSRQMHPQMQQIAHSKNVPFQQRQQLERMRRCQPSAPRAGMDTDKERPMVQVKIEAPSELPMDGNAFNSFNSRHPQVQFRQQQVPPTSNLTMSNVHAQSGNQFRQMASQIPQIQVQNMSVLRAPPVKVEGFQELMGGDTSSKHDSDENRLTSPSSK
ncbi:uncharacterized protein LOC103954710 isoform X1 [Pyrus x bretschneideri]|uniref:uncharacterized protein LOC103954710 isoform X1 n=1 Tax=Pyrus x bretschneideri TaxID=225117 RepID=UPI00202DC5EE|nr:uncharacterized protein LOC103954710 isoform X1 [Pyrus x bretschneideri]